MCLKARNCETKAFEANVILDPIPQPNQSLQEYLANLCQCGQQLVSAFDEPNDDIISIPHTKMCIEHTIHWMSQIIDLQIKHQRGEL